MHKDFYLIRTGCTMSITGIHLAPNNFPITGFLEVSSSITPGINDSIEMSLTIPEPIRTRGTTHFVGSLRYYELSSYGWVREMIKTEQNRLEEYTRRNVPPLLIIST